MTNHRSKSCRKHRYCNVANSQKRELLKHAKDILKTDIALLEYPNDEIFLGRLQTICQHLMKLPDNDPLVARAIFKIKNLYFKLTWKDL